VSLIGFRGRNHPQQIDQHGARADVDDRGTPPEVFDPLNKRFRFTLDVAASAHNAKCKRYYTAEDHGEAQSWAGERVWCNPPYSDIGLWVSKAWMEQKSAELIVMLLPANRTEQRWWQDLVEPHRDRPGSRLRVEFLAGRLRFLVDGRGTLETLFGEQAGHHKPNERPPFGCCLLIWEPVA
jgi:phage N-6-adenine-methyltransferase